MRTPRVYDTEAIVLRRTDFGEADRILTLFTPKGGKVRAIAKGVRRTTSRLAGHLEPFARAQLLLATGRDLDIVTQAESRERLDHLRDDLWHASGAWYIAELVDRFLEDADPHPRLYQLFTQTLRQLDAGAAAPASSRGWLALRYFELYLLGELGYRPALHQCASCDTPLTPIENGYNPELGGALCPRCSRYSQRRLSLTALKVLRLLQTTEWEALPKLRLSAAVRDEVEAVLQSTLRFHLDRDLKSWTFLQSAPAPESS
ncbi:MAG TPA: DNA repair protein RecO [Ktedonobacterales bacterium]|jgi:DNA repair protein RecO (recombination protein O)|nr:DNA repair protein RecO [Ktedonobacterales bacterium]